jgi:hypothetical protein
MKHLDHKKSPTVPDWIRLPQNGTSCPYSSLNRSAMDKLVRPQQCNNFDPPVESRILKMQGQKRGIRLISYSSLTKHLASLPDTQEVSHEKGAEGSARAALTR